MSIFTIASPLLSLGFSIAATLAAEAPFASGRWVDLTHDFSAETLYWPTAARFKLEPEFHGHTDKGYFYAANRYSASEHGGTHLDAPIHFAEGRKTVDQLTPDKLSGIAVVIHVAASVGTNADYQVSAEDLRHWEKQHGPIPSQAIVLLNTGFARHWPQAKKYLGTDEMGPDAVARLHFPGLHPEAAKWLVEQRKIKAVGVDTASIDYGQSTHFETHRILSERNIPIFENVAALDSVPALGAYVIALPMKIKDGSGAPLRIIAWIPKSQTP